MIAFLDDLAVLEDDDAVSSTDSCQPMGDDEAGAVLQQPGKRLLDVGCAAGFFMQDAKNAGWEVQGIDIAKPALDFAKKEFRF